MRRSIAASVFVLILGMTPIANASAAGRSILRGIGGHSAATPVRSSQGSKYTFDTSQGRFRQGVDNQGWYATRPTPTTDRNSNYVIGQCCGAGRLRDFFTFDLASLDARAVSATLVLSDPFSKGNPLERIRFSDVMTPARRLNQNGDVVPAIYSDLGHGQLFGQFAVATDRHPHVRRFQLNERAVQAINEARGGYFSVGGRLLGLHGRQTRIVFGGSDNSGAQRLIVRTLGA